MKVSIRSIFNFFFVLFFSVFLTATVAHSYASVSLRWDANSPAPEGYRVFAREAGASYDYAHPIWENSLTTCTLTGLTEGVTYYFVVRAFEGDLESVDSEEVSYTAPLSDDDSTNDTDVDSDGDNVVDSQDLFPNDPAEWADNDGDGVGDNMDADDDNDGMTDVWELAHGSAPLTADGDLDADGDGVSNLDEFLASNGNDGTTDNSAPDAPVVDDATGTELVNLTPVLVCGEYFDSDSDVHSQTRWQISTEDDFSTLVLDATSTNQLYSYTVGEMVLDADTIYFWRVQFIDANNEASEWSDTATFTTMSAESLGDADFNGVPDSQAADETADVNENGIVDIIENNLMTINTVEGQTTVGVETLSDTATLVSIKSISSDSIADQSVDVGFGLIGFKLFLQEGVSTASVEIHFSQQVPTDAKLYKHSIEHGWQEYENAVFAADGKSVTLVLEDGGQGDEDGVVNGVIVDPSGIVYEDSSEETAPDDSASLSTADSSGGAGGGGCFISAGHAGSSHVNATSATVAILLTVLLLGVGLVSAKAVQVKK